MKRRISSQLSDTTIAAFESVAPPYDQGATCDGRIRGCSRTAAAAAVENDAQRLVLGEGVVFVTHGQLRVVRDSRADADARMEQIRRDLRKAARAGTGGQP